MPHKSIRLIVADLDGTLLNSDHVVTPLTEQAVRAAIAGGVLFTVATGKTYPSTVALIRQFDIHIPLICGNGTQVFAPDGTLLHEAPIPLECALEALRLAAEAGFTPIVYTQMGLLSNVWDANVEELVDHPEPAPTIVPDLESALRNDHKPYKLVLMNRDFDRVPLFHVQLDGIFDGRAFVVRSGLQSVVEVLPLAVTKGTALEFILDQLGIGADETLCFGDNCNDVDMMQRAGIGVAMGNSPDDVQQAADYVTGTNDEDGVGHAIQKFVLA